MRKRVLLRNLFSKRTSHVSDSAKPREIIRAAIDNEDTMKLGKAFQVWPEELNNPCGVLGCHLRYACEHGSLEIIKSIIELGADINLRDSTLDFSPLNGACYQGRVDVVDYLLKAGAVIDVSTASRNPFFDCVRGGCYGGHETGENERYRQDTLKCAKVMIEAGGEVVTLYNSQAMVDMDVAAQAWMYGHRDITYLVVDHLYGNNERMAASALAEAMEVSQWNAISRQKFRKRRYPPTRGKNAASKPPEGEYWVDVAPST